VKKNEKIVKDTACARQRRSNSKKKWLTLLKKENHFTKIKECFCGQQKYFC
jgi:hypothetical protein